MGLNKNMYNPKWIILLVVSSLWWTACTTEPSGYRSQMIQLPTDLPVTDICFHKGDTGWLSVGTLFTDGALFESTNRGNSWRLLQSTAVGVNSIDNSNNQLSYSQSGNTLQRSADGGNTFVGHIALAWWKWTEHIKLPNGTAILVGGENFGRGFVHQHQLGQVPLVLTDTFEHELKDIAYTPNGKLYLVGYGLIAQSNDEGNTWEASSVVGDFFVAVDFPTNTVGYVLGKYGTVYKTINAGGDWSAVRTGNSLFADAKDQFTDMAFWNNEEGLLIGTQNNVWRTRDGGKNWKKLTDLTGWANFESITIDYPQAYLGGQDGKLLVIDLE
jgi:photosystem II stability/assembly factor-like uncharacterized protein